MMESISLDVKGKRKGRKGEMRNKMSKFPDAGG